jgi:Cu/Ag efflux protein CusF
MVTQGSNFKAVKLPDQWKAISGCEPYAALCVEPRAGAAQMKPLCSFGVIMMGLVLSSPVPGQDNSAASIAKGEVTKVDLTEGKITIKHGPIASMKMNATEAYDDFKVNEQILLNALRPGDKINFIAKLVDGQPTIMRVETPK